MLLSRLCMCVCVAALASASRSEPASKRLPSGFQGMRGKKSIDYSGLEEPYISPAELERVASYLSYPNIHDSSGYLYPQGASDPWSYMGYQTNNIYEPANRLASYKRAPMGFQGMRGKKELMDPRLDYEYNGHNYDMEEDFKDKRAPMGFQGMRGKRQFEYPAYSYTDKRASLGFQGMRGKKSDDLTEQYLNNFNGGTPNENEKKIIDEKVSDGKEGDQSSVTNNPLNYANEQTTDNRSPRENELTENGIATSGGLKSRRSANMGFYGMRGKKLPSASSFFGMRGKKGPFDYGFRGKFVGVRGKKMYQDNLDDLQQLTDKLTWTADELQKRKGPSGFMGMRGKKWANFDGEFAMGDMQGHHDGVK